jgi:hypothetical protein
MVPHPRFSHAHGVVIKDAEEFADLLKYALSKEG